MRNKPQLLILLFAAVLFAGLFFPTVQGQAPQSIGAPLINGVSGQANLTTVGAVPYVNSAGNLNQDQTAGGQFFWDPTNHRLGIGTATPSQLVHIYGASSNADTQQQLLVHGNGTQVVLGLEASNGQIYSIRNNGGTASFRFTNYGDPLTMTTAGAVNVPMGPLTASFGVLSGGTFPTITGCGTISATAGGATAGTFATNTTGTCAAVIPLPTAPNGWTCYVQDLTKHVATNIMIQSASATNSCTVTGTTASGDVMNFLAIGW
jgi:hypothetical protein